MSEAKADFKFWGSKEILVALIGVSGVLIVGILSNLDKIFPSHGKVTAEYSGYQPTGDFETELRYYLDVSGSRKADQLIRDTLLEGFRTSPMLDTIFESLKTVAPELTRQDPRNDQLVLNKMVEIMKKHLPKFDDTINESLPIYQKYYTVSQLQELNKFYSTRPMRDMIEKMPIIQKELGPIMVENQFKFQRKFFKEIMEMLKSEKSQEKHNSEPTK